MKYLKEGKNVFGFVALILAFRLKWPYTLALFALALILLFVNGKTMLALCQNRERKETSAFYLEQLLHSFCRRHKISGAFGDLMEICEGSLWQCVSYAQEEIMQGWSSENCLRNAFGKIEEHYGCEPMFRIHGFLMQVEETGGDCDAALSLLADQVCQWKSWQITVIESISSQFAKLQLTVFLSGLVSLMVVRILPDFDAYRRTEIYQVSGSVCLLILMVLSGLFCLWMDRSLRDEHGQEHYNYEDLWTDLQSRRKAILNWRKTRRLKKDIMKAFPDWLMDMLLRLQTENVVSAVRHSIDHAHPVLVYPLCQMVTAMEENPLSKQPFLDFLKELDMAEVRTVMLQMYAIRDMGKDDIGKQILVMLEQEQAMEARAADLDLQDRMGMIGLYAAIPMMVSVLMMVFEMSVFLLRYLEQYAEGSWL